MRSVATSLRRRRVSEATAATLGRSRLWRELLRELQTGGGLSLDMLSPDAATSEAMHQHLPAIRRGLTRIRQLRAQAPERAADLISALVDQPRAIADLGAGRAPWSIALARRLPHARFLAIDLPGETVTLTEAVRAQGLAGQFEVRGADLLRDPVAPAGSLDIVVLGNVAHLFDAETLRAVLSRAAGLLRAGGVFCVIDQVLDDDPDWAVWSALYAVGACAWLPGGTLYTESEYRALLVESRCSWLGMWPLSPSPTLTLMAARR